MNTHSSILAWRIQWTIPWGHPESVGTEERTSLGNPKESCFGESQNVSAFRPFLWSCPVFPENSLSLPERTGEVKDFHKYPGSPAREVGLRFYFSVFRFSPNSPVFSLGSHQLLISLNQGALWSVPAEYKATIPYWTGEVYSSDFKDEGWEAGGSDYPVRAFHKIFRIQSELPLTNVVPDAYSRVAITFFKMNSHRCCCNLFWKHLRFYHSPSCLSILWTLTKMSCPLLFPLLILFVFMSLCLLTSSTVVLVKLGKKKCYSSVSKLPCLTGIFPNDLS